VSKKILVVDDERRIIDALKEALEFNSFEVVCAADGLEAWDKLSEEIPDIILSDLSMPGLDGKGLFEMVKACEAKRDIPFIFMSATPETLYQLRPHAVLRKPFQFETLIRELENALESHG
jgi:two-component system response regulator VicR